MTIFNGGYELSMNNGLMNLSSVKQMLFCIAQNDSSSQELDTHTILGVSNILEEIGYEIEQSYDRIRYKREAAERRHSKLREAIAVLKESESLIGRSDLDRILKADEEVPNAD